MGLAKILSFVLAIYLVAGAMLYAFQRDFIYFPAHTYVSPSQAHAHKTLRSLLSLRKMGSTSRDVMHRRDQSALPSYTAMETATV
jgi:cytochrome c-type biogenesis protein CcmE